MPPYIYLAYIAGHLSQRSLQQQYRPSRAYCISSDSNQSERITSTMPKLSPSLKSLLSIPASNPHSLPIPPLPRLTSTLDNIRSRGAAGKIGAETWLTVLAAAGVTVNSPESFVGIWEWARPKLREGFNVPAEGGSGLREVKGVEGERWGAGMMREVGLKCISFNGVSRSPAGCRGEADWQIPRTINALNAFRDALPEEITSGLSAQATR